MDKPITYRINAVAKKLGVSRSTVYRLAKDECLKLVKISKGIQGVTADSLIQHMRRIGAM